MKTCPTCGTVRPLEEFREYEKYRCIPCLRKCTQKYLRTPKGRFHSSVGTAKRRGLTFSISQEEYYNLIAEPCHYCHGELDPTGVGLDRIDNNSGYIPGNVVSCCGLCNRIKSDSFSYEQMVALGAVISQFRKSSPLTSGV